MTGTIHAIPGIRENTYTWRGPDKYDYHLNRRMNGGRYSMRCTQFYELKCRGRASVGSDGQHFKQTQPHCHDPDRYKVEMRCFRQALMSRCRVGDKKPFRRMYHETRRALK